ncbi:MAG: hypothetical protein PVG44_09575 [Desulfobacterales bacterium]|jgi:hypothetical protein
MKKHKIILISSLTLVAVIIGFIVYALTPPKGDRYYFPEKYDGWICVSYNVEDAPPLVVEDGFLVHKIPPNGILKTSSAPRLSPKADEYFYYTENVIRTAKELKHGGGFSRQKKGQLVAVTLMQITKLT